MTERPKAYSYIRMSTAKQLHGDSLRRQTAKALEFCEQNNLQLDSEFKLQDIGVSAYTGDNLATGDLGRFIQAVKAGQIAPGSWLIIESHDRFSRMTPQQAMPHFLDILNAGITIAVLSENKIFKPNEDPHSLLYAIVGMIRSHEESARKSQRGRAARDYRREHLDEKIMTSMCPGWLKPKPDKTGFDPIPDRVEVVKLMFEMARSMGDHAITSELNRRAIRNFGPGKNGWQKSSVAKILTSRSVLGEYQPHVVEAGKRVPTGEVARGYYPPVVEEDLFYAVQQHRSLRKMAGGGRLGHNVANLFAKIACCGHCHGSISVRDRGPNNGGRYFVCDNAARGRGCRRAGWSVKSFETSFFTFVKEIQLAKVTGEFIHKNELATKRQQLEVTKGRLLEAQRIRDVAYQLLTENAPTPFRFEKFEEADRKVSLLELQLAQLEQEQAGLLAENRSFGEGGRAIIRLLQEIEGRGAEEAFVLRTRLRAAIADVVERIFVFPEGLGLTREQIRDRKRAMLAAAKRAHGSIPLSFAKSLIFNTHFNDRPDRTERLFVVRFRNGSERIVKPDSKDPSRLDRVQDSGQDVIVREQVIEMAPRFGLDPSKPEEFDLALDRLREVSRRNLV